MAFDFEVVSEHRQAETIADSDLECCPGKRRVCRVAGGRGAS